MAGSNFVDVVKFSAASGGTGSFVVSAAITGYQTPATAGAITATQYSYRAESSDLTQWEVGQGTYTGSSTTLSRTPLFNSAGGSSAINFTLAPNVGFVALNEDLLTANITKTIQQTGTSNTAGVTPLHQQDHDSAVKAWGQFTQSAGTYTNAASYNVASITRVSTGTVTINFTTSFASTAFAVVFSLNQSPPATAQENYSVRNASNFQVILQTVSSAPAVTDIGFSFAAMGRQ